MWREDWREAGRQDERVANDEDIKRPFAVLWKQALERLKGSGVFPLRCLPIYFTALDLDGLRQVVVCTLSGFWLYLVALKCHLHQHVFLHCMCIHALCKVAKCT